MEEEKINLRITEEENMEPSEHQKKSTIKKGGLKTMPFIIVNESFERISSYGLMPNMILYLMNGYNMTAAKGSSILSLWSALSNFLAIFGAFLSDSYLGRFRVIALGSIFSLLGMTLLWLTAMVPQAKPPPCNPSDICKSPTLVQLAVLLFSFGFMSIGAGCIRPCSIAFGADQFAKKDKSQDERVLDSYFNWYYASIGISTILALTIIVYIQDNLGWQVGFGVPVSLMFLSAFFFLVGSSFYVHAKVEKSLFTGLAQVFVAAFKKRHLTLPLDNSDECYYHSKDSELLVPSEKLRFLNKACIIRNPEDDLNLDGSASKPWELCTVNQVEELKSMIRIIPIWSTGFIIYMTLNQSSITVIQAKSLDRHITSTLEFPAGSFSLFTIVTLTIWVALYDRVISPQLEKFTGRARVISPRQRMGAGLVLSYIAMVVAAIVESIRRKIAIQEGFSDDPSGVVSMSAMWLVPQFCLNGLAEAFNAIGQIEFYYSQLPKSMSSIAVAFFTLGTAFSELLGSLIIIIVNDVTESWGKVSWLSSNLNKGHYDYYYGLLSFLSLLNILYFLVCSWSYGPSEERSRVSNEGEGVKEGLLSNSGELPSSSSV